MRNAARVVGAYMEPPSARWDGSWQLAVRWCHLIGQPRGSHNVLFRSFCQTNFCWFSCKRCPRLSDNVLSLPLKNQGTLGLSQVVGVPLSLIASHKNVYHVLFQLKGRFCLFFSAPSFHSRASSRQAKTHNISIDCNVTVVRARKVTSKHCFQRIGLAE